MVITLIPSLEDDLSYFDTKIEHKVLYLESLKKAAEQEMDTIRGQWFDSAIDNIQDLVNILAYCKNKLQATSTQTTLRRSTFATSPSSPATTSSCVKPRRSLSVGPVKVTPPSAVTPLVSQSDASPTSSPPRYTSVDDATLVLRVAENKKSITFMNVPESTAFEYAERRRSDVADVQKILNVTGVSARVENVNRFSPKSLQADRPPFLKVRFSSEEEKKQVFAAVLSNISRIRSLRNEFAQVTASDPAKTVNKYRTNIASSTFGSNVSHHKSADPVLSPTFVLPLSDCQDASNGNNVYPSTNRQHTSNNVAAPLDSTSSRQTVNSSSIAMAATSANNEPLGDRFYTSKISTLDCRLRQTFSSPKKPSSVQVARYTQGGSGQYTSDDEN